MWLGLFCPAGALNLAARRLKCTPWLLGEEVLAAQPLLQKVLCLTLRPPASARFTRCVIFSRSPDALRRKRSVNTAGTGAPCATLQQHPKTQTSCFDWPKILVTHISTL